MYLMFVGDASRIWYLAYLVPTLHRSLFSGDPDTLKRKRVILGTFGRLEPLYVSTCS